MKNKPACPSRSFLFVPGNRPDRFDKALSSGADTVIIDLEDAVSPELKNEARDIVANYLTQERCICLRVNGADTEWFKDDLELCSMPGVDSIMLPKVESMEQINRVTGRVDDDKPVLPFIETAVGLKNMYEVANAHRVRQLVFGTLDFILDLGLNVDGDELNSVRLQIVLASRLAGILPPVEGVSQDIKDLDGLRNDAIRARNLGFAGKLCIHPSQVDIVNESFSYSQAEIEWAKQVIEAAGKANGGVFSVNGRMVDRPVIEKARLIIEQTNL